MNPPALLPLDDAQARHAAESIGRLRRALQGVLFGQNDLIDLVIVGVLARGHVLLEGLPGLGKTELVKGLARALDLKHKRVQFTPDLLPGDITGNPVRQDLMEVASKKEEALTYFNLDVTKKTLLILGGSLGSRRINQLRFFPDF
jgi:MoxR-like ATPase